VTASVTTTVTKSVSENIARNLLKSGSSPEYVATATEMSLQAVLELQKNL
jgi:ERCC4-type nuclease